MGLFDRIKGLFVTVEDQINDKTGNINEMEMTCKEVTSALAKRACELYGYDNVMIDVGKNSFGEKHVQARVKVDEKWHYLGPFAIQTLQGGATQRWFGSSWVLEVRDRIAELTLDQFEFSLIESRYRQRQDERWEKHSGERSRSVLPLYESIWANVDDSVIDFFKDM